MAPAVDVARLDEGRRDAEARQRVVQQVVRAAAERARATTRAGTGQRRDRQVQRGLAAGGGDRPYAPRARLRTSNAALSDC